MMEGRKGNVNNDKRNENEKQKEKSMRKRSIKDKKREDNRYLTERDSPATRSISSTYTHKPSHGERNNSKKKVRKK